jgi:hypothetical protein
MSQYVAVCAYYGEPGVSVDIVDNDDDMREYYNEQLEGYGIETDELSEWGLEDLIEFTIIEGREVVRQNLGWGLMHVLRGDNMKEIVPKK